MPQETILGVTNDLSQISYLKETCREKQKINLLLANQGKGSHPPIAQEKLIKSQGQSVEKTPKAKVMKCAKAITRREEDLIFECRIQRPRRPSSCGSAQFGKLREVTLDVPVHEIPTGIRSPERAEPATLELAPSKTILLLPTLKPPILRLSLVQTKRKHQCGTIRHREKQRNQP